MPWIMQKFALFKKINFVWKLSLFQIKIADFNNDSSSYTENSPEILSNITETDSLEHFKQKVLLKTQRADS